MKILVVDDDRKIVKTTCDILKLKGHEPIVAFTGDDALEMVRQHQPDCVLMDLTMPGISGVDALKRIKAEAPLLPVVLASAFANDATCSEAKASGAYGILPKPFDFERVLAFMTLLTKQETILVVDDDGLFCNAISTHLKERGFHVETESDPDKVLGDLERHYTLVILLDLNLGLVNGVEVMKQVRRHYRTKPVVLMTAYANEMAEFIEQGLRNGAHSCVYKPLDVDALTHTIENIRRDKLQNLLHSA